MKLIGTNCQAIFFNGEPITIEQCTIREVEYDAARQAVWTARRQAKELKKQRRRQSKRPKR